jgi:hypothetical protein
MSLPENNKQFFTLTLFELILNNAARCVCYNAATQNLSDKSIVFEQTKRFKSFKNIENTNDLGDLYQTFYIDFISSQFSPLNSNSEKGTFKNQLNNQ